MNNYCIKYNNGRYRTVEGKSTVDAEERLKRSTKGIVIIEETIKIKNDLKRKLLNNSK